MEFREVFWKIRTNPLFENAVITIIILSAIAVGASTFKGMQQWEHIINTVDTFVTVFFLIEIVIKLISEKKWWHFFKDSWNVFDFIIVGISLIPVEGSGMILVARLLRIFRVLRMVTVLPELKILIESLTKSLKSIGYISLLLFIIFYIFGAIGSFLFNEAKSGLWSDVLTAMLTLFRVMTLEDWTDVMYETMAIYPWSWAYYVLFIFLSAFTFFNLFVGVIIDQFGEEKLKAQKEKEAAEAADQPEKIDLEKEVLELKAMVKELSEQLLKKEQEQG